MWTPEEGATIFWVDGSSSCRTPSENGPVALMIPCKSVMTTTTRFHTYSTPDIPLIAGHPVFDSSTAYPVGALDLVELLMNFGYLNVVGHDGTVLDSSQDQGDIHSRVVVLSCTSVGLTWLLTHHHSRPHHRRDRHPSTWGKPPKPCPCPSSMPTPYSLFRPRDRTSCNRRSSMAAATRCRWGVGYYKLAPSS